MKLLKDLATKIERTSITVDEQVFTVYMKPLSYKTLKQIQTDGTDSMPSVLATSVCDEFGTPVFTVEEIENLNIKFFNALSQAAEELFLGK